MRDVLGPGTVLGYCTNVHAGASWPEIRASLAEHAVGVRERVIAGAPGAGDLALPVGLWIPAAAARHVVDEGVASEMREFLAASSLAAFTLNGFPHDDFHEEVVKDRVYRPSWIQALRAEYTHDLAMLLEELAGPGRRVSVSTVPLGWPGHGEWGDRQMEAAAMQLITIASICAGYLEAEDLHITVDLEPEPGCVLERASDVVEFVEGYLRPLDERGVTREHIGVCHDVCHAAVMFEDQVEELRRYAEAGIRVNKVQLSNAPRVARGVGHGGDREAAFAELRRFVEPRYLHQTMARAGEGERFFEDLPRALAALEGDPADPLLGSGEWRVHFHVPVFLERVGALATTQDQIGPAIRAARELHDTKTFEVETYAWGVLPEGLRTGSLAEGIARELLWVKGLAEREGLS